MWLPAAKRLLPLHRRLGVACGVCVAVWFASVVVMMSAPLPRLTAEERLFRLPPLDTAGFTVGPDKAAQRAGYTVETPPDRLRVSTALGRPIYRFARGLEWRAVFADTGEPVLRLSDAEAEAVARMFAPEHGRTTRYDGRLDRADSWTRGAALAALMPLHRIALGDEAGTTLYVADRTAEVVLATDGRDRRLGAPAAWAHRAYVALVRPYASVWHTAFIAVSIVGGVVCLSSLATGVRRRSNDRPGHGGRTDARRRHWRVSAAQALGLVVCAWTLSGLLLAPPGRAADGGRPGDAERRAMAGGGLALAALALPDLSHAAALLRDDGVLKEIEVLQVHGTPYYAAYRFSGAPIPQVVADTDLTALVEAQGGPPRRIVPALGRPARAFAAFEQAQLERAARGVVPGAAIVDATWLERRGACCDLWRQDRRRPVLRMRFDDPDRTWLYADAETGALVSVSDRRHRLARWLAPWRLAIERVTS